MNIILSSILYIFSFKLVKKSSPALYTGESFYSRSYAAMLFVYVVQVNVKFFAAAAPSSSLIITRILYALAEVGVK